MIYADFQNLDDNNRLRLTCAGTKQDLERHGLSLQEGLILTFYMDDADDQGQPDDLLAEGIIQFNTQENCWVALVDWSALRHASDDPLLQRNGISKDRAELPASRKN